MIIYKTITIIFSVLIVSQSNCIAQESDTLRHYSLSAKYGYGFVYMHHKSFEYLIKDYVQSFELNTSFRTKGNKIWHKLYNYPSVGFGYKYSNLGNPQILGNANSMYTFISVPIIEKEKIKFSYKCTGGVAFLSEKFDLHNNHYNIAIGTNLNAYLNLNLDLDYRFADKIHFLLGFGLSHYSNGGLQQPNNGLNIFSAQTGLLYNVNKEKYNMRIDTLANFSKINEFSIIYSFGFKGLHPAKEHKYMISSLSINFDRQYSYKSRFGVGLDLFKDNSRKEYLKEEGIENPVTKDLFYAGSHLSYDFVFGKTNFTIQLGAYFWQKAKFFESTYNRFGIKYYFSEHLLANLTLKTHWASADFIEWGLGFRF